MLAAHTLSYRPASSRQWLWPPLEFDTGSARRVLLAGASGSGKSTLLRILCGLLPGFRGGELRGQVALLGRPAARRPDGRVGLLFQNPDVMLHSPRVADELRARARAAGTRHDADPRRNPWLAELIAELGLAELLDRRIVELSGGEQQRVALAAVLVARPRVVLLDEPTSNLDPQAAATLVSLITRCAARFGTRFVFAEHRAEHLRGLLDGAVRLNDGSARSWSGAAGAAPEEVLPPRLDLRALRKLADATRPGGAQPRVLACRDVGCRRGGRLVLRGLDLELHAGEIVGLTGPNGAGKSTLLLLLAGGLRTATGEIRWPTARRRRQRWRRVGLLLQNPLHQLFCQTVRQEVALAAANARLENGDAQIGRLLEAADLLHLAERPTLALSYGEQQRTALAAALSSRPAVVLLDEPTHGMDAARLEQIVRFLLEARAAGTAFIVTSHDRELLAAFCDRVLTIRDGRLE